jgi:hypothetical protein
MDITSVGSGAEAPPHLTTIKIRLRMMIGHSLTPRTSMRVEHQNDWGKKDEAQRALPAELWK